MKTFNQTENFNPFLTAEKREKGDIKYTDSLVLPGWMSQVFGTLIFEEGDME